MGDRQAWLPSRSVTGTLINLPPTLHAACPQEWGADRHNCSHTLLTSSAARSSSTGVGGRVAWLPRRMTGFLARDTSCTHRWTETRQHALLTTGMNTSFFFFPCPVDCTGHTRVMRASDEKWTDLLEWKPCCFTQCAVTISGQFPGWTEAVLALGRRDDSSYCAALLTRNWKDQSSFVVPVLCAYHEKFCFCFVLKKQKGKKQALGIRTPACVIWYFVLPVFAN